MLIGCQGVAHFRAANPRIEYAFLAGRLGRRRGMRPVVGAVFCSARFLHGLIKAEKDVGVECLFRCCGICAGVQKFRFALWVDLVDTVTTSRDL